MQAQDQGGVFAVAGTHCHTESGERSSRFDANEKWIIEPAGIEATGRDGIVSIVGLNTYFGPGAFNGVPRARLLRSLNALLYLGEPKWKNPTTHSA
jgi:hypothetical protein